MPFIKVVKNRSYFRRFQVKYRRRREGKTDYQARRNMVIQDLTKYGTPKYRLVVRFTNRDVIAQIIYSKIRGDFVLAQAYSHELPRYGVEFGLTNYASAYAVGLLVARRSLTKLNLADRYLGQVEANGEFYTPEAMENGPRPFNVLLDVGLVRTSTGHRVFAAMKGASDGGINIPHTTRRFVGHPKERDGEFDASILRKYIFGGHVSEYMEYLQANNETQYKTQFSRYIASNVQSSDIEELYRKAHESIRANPQFVKKVARVITAKPKRYNLKKLSYEERKARIAAKLLTAPRY